MNSRHQGILLVLLSAFGFGLMPIFAVGAYQNGVNVQTLLVLRFSIATLFFFGLLRLKRVTWIPSRRQLGAFFLLGGVLYTLQSMLYFSAVRLIPSSLAALLLYTYPVIVCLLAIAVEKKPLRLRTRMALLISFVGISLVLGTPAGDVRLPGILAALGAALVYSVYITAGNRVVSQVPSLVTSAFVALFASGSMLISGLISDSIDFGFRPSAWPFIGGVALFSTVIAIFAFFLGMSKIGSSQASILSTVEPLVTIGFAALIHGESLTPAGLLGSVLVVAGALLSVSEKNEPFSAEQAETN
jgi:drug/metabolite transporter (DMT)-like permease